MTTTLSPETIKQTIAFHGHWCPGLALGTRAAEWALEEMGKAADEEILRVAHRTLKKVTGDIDRFAFNTAVAALMEYGNALRSYVAGPAGARQETFSFRPRSADHG